MLAVLRLGHRVGRDKRVTTHVALAARALGADKVYISSRDGGLVRTLKSVIARFGGDFDVEDGVDWRRIVKTWPGVVVHLTMYGMPLDEVLPKLPKDDILVVVGAEKVPPEIFDLATFNIAIGNQPHSEVAALAIFLDRLLRGAGLRKEFRGRLIVVPSERGKKVLDSNERRRVGR